MDLVALRSKRNKRFTIQQFEMMSVVERESYHNNIVCDECGGDAYYRGSAKDGKTACFAAKHIVGCQTARGSKSSNSEGDEETNQFEMSSDFDIAWNYVSMKGGITNGSDDENETDTGKSLKKYITKPAIAKKSKISLGTILKCAEYEILKDQEYFINVPDVGLKQLNEVVIKMEDINDSHLNKILFLWGRIHSFKENWINTLYANNLSIRINETIKEKFWDAYKTKIIKFLHHKNGIVIIFGKVRKSTKGNYYITLNEIKHFYIKKSII